ncbi:eukaryotic translation initiation factor 4E-binding protein Mextli isoform X2 [Sitodiplosis mosellana]|uniref:eukaryotic translation initiation factor 4E-binding protein Mextli isoform X2 n=1 Tax=Sitodiplosis mosellana TaxID=263140 RepID=UPI0024442344|nr:eukaryotic translation initiation factor 4E-binding protein Mextli isoform X2 [Sitodiplosis mosellana]
MSQVSRSLKNLEAPRPLKSNNANRQTHHTTPAYELQTIEELITLVENVADSVSIGQCNPDSMALLLSNLRILGPQLEEYSKSTLDQAYVKFRNASQDERLSIITRMNLLELIELRAKNWHVSDGLNTYYKHKVSDVQPENIMVAPVLQDISLLDTSPSSVLTHNILNPGEVIRTSGKFVKPTKIPGKNYTKDEVVIRNADSGKVNPGAKERLVQITGPNEEKIIYAKHLIEDTIRRNASPVRLDETASGVVGAGSCSSLTSSNSDETQIRVNRSSVAGMPSASGYTHVAGNQKVRGAAGNVLLHSLSTNDASVGEYKFTVNVGHHSIKITGDSLDLVRISKLVLDEYFTSTEFISGVEAGAEFGLMNSSSTASVTTPTTVIPLSHQLNSTSPFGDSGVDLNQYSNYHASIDNEDEVFIVEKNDVTQNNTDATKPIPTNGLTRSRRSHFSLADTKMDSLKEIVPKRKSDVHVSYDNDRLKLMATFHHSHQFPHDWLKICELYPNIVRNKTAEDEDKFFNPDTYERTYDLTTTIKQNSPLLDDKHSEPLSDSD